jgi:hypothetical protein
LSARSSDGAQARLPPDATAFWVEAPGVGGLRRTDLGETPAGSVRIQALYSGISRGTEATVFHGRVPTESAPFMVAPFQEGTFPSPVKYGYASVGRVVEAPAAPERRDPPDPDETPNPGDTRTPSDRLQPGDLVFCLFPHQDHYVVPASAARKVPAGVPARRAVLAANAETALNAVWDAAIGPGDAVSVVGGGVLGSLIAWLAGDIPGTQVTLVDVRPDRAATATALGVRFALPADAPVEQDVVIHTSGSAAGLSTCLSLAGDEAVVLEVSWYGTNVVPVALGGAFHHRRLQLRSSQVGQLPPSRRPRWDYGRRMQTALALLVDPRLDVLLEDDVPFLDLPARMAALTADGAGGLCHPVRYPSGTESP